MTAEEKRALIVKSALTREKKNKYSQADNKRLLIESGYGDCSGTCLYWYQKCLGMDIGINTEAQINSKLGTRVKLTITNGVPDESKLKPADLLYFRGSDNSRTEGVGHVEMFIGNGKCFGHGSGTGGTVKNLASYCKYRQSLTSTTKLKNKGFICAIRFIADDPVVVKPVETKPVETKKEDEPMTAQEKQAFEKLQNRVKELENSLSEATKVYHYTSELPDWAKPSIQKLLDKGIYAGASKSDLNLPAVLMRTLVINDRAGIYD